MKTSLFFSDVDIQRIGVVLVKPHESRPAASIKDELLVKVHLQHLHVFLMSGQLHAA